MEKRDEKMKEGGRGMWKRWATSQLCARVFNAHLFPSVSPVSAPSLVQFLLQIFIDLKSQIPSMTPAPPQPPVLFSKGSLFSRSYAHALLWSAGLEGCRRASEIRLYQWLGDSVPLMWHHLDRRGSTASL